MNPILKHIIEEIKINDQYKFAYQSHGRVFLSGPDNKEILAIYPTEENVILNLLSFIPKVPFIHFAPIANPNLFDEIEQQIKLVIEQNEEHKAAISYLEEDDIE